MWNVCSSRILTGVLTSVITTVMRHFSQSILRAILGHTGSKGYGTLYAAFEIPRYLQSQQTVGISVTEVLFAFSIKSVWKVPAVSTEIAHLARWARAWYVRTFGKTCQLSQGKVQVFMGTMKWCWVALKGICGVIWDRDLKAFWLKLFWTYQNG